jgi:hypothetical protein
MYLEASESESLSDSATCFPAAADEVGPSKLLGMLLMMAPKRCKRVVRDAEGSLVYLGGAKAAMFARRCTFSSTPRTEIS